MAAIPEGMSHVDDELPMTLELFDDTPPGSWEADFVAGLGATPAWLRWDLGAWPAGPFGYRDTEYSGVQIGFSSRDRFFDPPPSGRAAHMVYLCTSMGQSDRAEWLAEQVGTAVLGDPIQSL